MATDFGALFADRSPGAAIVIAAAGTLSHCNRGAQGLCSPVSPTEKLPDLH
jgi:hypothetical protein